MSSLLQLYRAQQGLCHYCKQLMEDPRIAAALARRRVPPGSNIRDSPHHPTLDHLIPKARGGTNLADNQVASCGYCNNRKGPLTDAEYLSVMDDAVALKELIREVSRNIELMQVKSEAPPSSVIVSPFSSPTGLRSPKTARKMSRAAKAMAFESWPFCPHCAGPQLPAPPGLGPAGGVSIYCDRCGRKIPGLYIRYA